MSTQVIGDTALSAATVSRAVVPSIESLRLNFRRIYRKLHRAKVEHPNWWNTPFIREEVIGDAFHEERLRARRALKSAAPVLQEGAR